MAVEQTIRKRFVWRYLICAWCGKQISKVPDVSGEYSHDYESHGICKRCDEREFGKIKP